MVTSITTTNSLVLTGIRYQIGSGAPPSTLTLPVNLVQNPICGFQIKYTILNPDSSLALKPQANGTTILEVSELDPLKARIFNAKLKVGLADTS